MSSISAMILKDDSHRIRINELESIYGPQVDRYNTAIPV